jgi:hypothetical protein
MSELKRLFSDPNAKTKAQMLLKRLNQGAGSVLNFSVKFRTLCVDSGYNQTALMSLFRDGLSNQIKDILAASLVDPEDLESLMELAIKIDTRLFDRKMETSQRSNTTLASASSADISNNYKWKKISLEERQRRIKENLCMYCGGPGHVANNCPKKKSRKSGTKYPPATPAAAVAENPSGSQQ